MADVQQMEQDLHTEVRALYRDLEVERQRFQGGYYESFSKGTYLCSLFFASLLLNSAFLSFVVYGIKD